MGERGVPAEQFTDDRQATEYLLAAYQQARQMQPLAQYGQMWLQHQDVIQKAIAGQQQPQPAQQPESWFKAPEWNDGWLSMVDTDQAGNMIAKPGFPPDIPQKIAAFRQHQRDFFNKFSIDPIGTIKQGIVEAIKPMIEEQFKSNLNGFKEQSFVQNFVEQNSSWLHQRDAQGRVIVDPISMQPILTPIGQQFRSHIDMLAKSGVTDVRLQEQIARQLLGQQIQQAQATPAAVNDAQKAAFLQQAQQAARQPGYGGTTLPGTNPNTAPPSQNANMTLAQRLATSLAAAGVTDADFQADRM